MKYRVLLISVLLLSGCRTFPRRDLTTDAGVIAAYFNRPPSDIILLREEGLTDEELVKVLLISSASYLSDSEIIGMMSESELAEIASEAGLDPEFIQTRARHIIQRAATH